MLGFIFSIIAGAAMSLQGVMNTRVSEKIGLFESNLYVQGSAFLLSLVAYFIMGNFADGKGFSGLSAVPRQYLFGGVLGLVITVTVMLGIRDLSPTLSISVILISQLIVAALIDARGWLGAERCEFGITKVLGVALMLGGVVLFKIKT